MGNQQPIKPYMGNVKRSYGRCCNGRASNESTGQNWQPCNNDMGNDWRRTVASSRSANRRKHCTVDSARSKFSISSKIRIGSGIASSSSRNVSRSNVCKIARRSKTDCTTIGKSSKNSNGRIN